MVSTEQSQGSLFRLLGHAFQCQALFRVILEIALHLEHASIKRIAATINSTILKNHMHLDAAKYFASALKKYNTRAGWLRWLETRGQTCKEANRPGLIAV